jgi:SAM-dependent methyltransferase
MLEHQNELYVGAPRAKETFRKTIEVITGNLRRLGTFSGERMLDVGCGEGGFTMVLGRDFREVHGIDVQEEYLQSFRAAVAGDPRYTIKNMSASAMTYPAAHFDTIVTIETLEHVPDLAGAAREIARVLRPGGELVITVPNRWFPFENHGMRIGSWERHGRIPLLTYLPWLHRRISIARVFKAGELDALFTPHGMRRAGLGYAWPTFEHPGNRLQPLLKPLFGLMRTMEQSPLRMFGSSVIVRYVKA